MSGNSLLYDVVIRETTILQDYRCTCGSVAFKLFQASELIESRLQIKIRGLVVKRNGSAGVRTPAIYLTLFVQELGTAARLHVQCEGRYPYVFADLFGPGPVTGFAGKPDRGLRLQRSPPGSERRQLALIAVKPGVTLDPIFLDAGSSERLKQSQKTKSPERWMVSTSSTCGDLLQHFPHIVQEKCLSFCTSIVLRVVAAALGVGRAALLRSRFAAAASSIKHSFHMDFRHVTGIGKPWFKTAVFSAGAPALG